MLLLVYQTKLKWTQRIETSNFNKEFETTSKFLATILNWWSNFMGVIFFLYKRNSILLNGIHLYTKLFYRFANLAAIGLNLEPVFKWFILTIFNNNLDCVKTLWQQKRRILNKIRKFIWCFKIVDHGILHQNMPYNSLFNSKFSLNFW